MSVIVVVVKLVVLLVVVFESDVGVLVVCNGARGEDIVDMIGLDVEDVAVTEVVVGGIDIGREVDVVNVDGFII